MLEQVVSQRDEKSEESIMIDSEVVEIRGRLKHIRTGVAEGTQEITIELEGAQMGNAIDQQRFFDKHVILGLCENSEPQAEKEVKSE